ncbi:MAG: hypothetical protein EU550_01880 [Promethearchaeota archaeon]|nr:MAG: hypothetical protein EU550_01880 [Candidatus Lokiarchaeota archaeon]
MNFLKILDELKKKYTSLILYCLLDRVPIVVKGDDPFDIDDVLIELSNIVDFRKEFVFNVDFVSNREYENLINNENIDYNSQRIFVRCPQNVTLLALKKINSFRGWLIGFSTSMIKEDLNLVETQLSKELKKFLIITLNRNHISIKLEGFDLKEIDLSLENTILRKISEDTEKSIARMKRVVLEKIKNSTVEKSLIRTLLDFSVEKEELKKNIFKKELRNFHSGSKRAFFILSRLNLLSKFETTTTIGSKTLLETIDYEDASIERIISFIKDEWNEDFSNLIENAKKASIGDKIQSLWG